MREGMCGKTGGKALWSGYDDFKVQAAGKHITLLWYYAFAFAYVVYI